MNEPVSTPLGMTDDDMRAATRVRLLARAAADAQARRLPEASVRVSTRPQSRWAIASLALALAASLVFAVMARRDAAVSRSALSDQATNSRRLVDSLASIVAVKNQFIASLTGPSVQVMSLTAAGARTARALMFWDTAKNHWTFVAHALPPLAPGRTYQLWFVLGDRKVSGGTFAVTSAGDGVLEADFSLVPASLSAIAVTEEAVGGAPQPTTAPVIAVTAGKT